MKVALVYDRVNKWGGAERVLLALKTIFPDAPLYTSVYNKKTALWAKDFRVTPSFLQHFPYASSMHEKYPLLMPIAFEQFTFDEYDLVVSVTSEAAKGVITKPHTKHISYCLTPTRYLWSGYDMYFSNSVVRMLTKPAVAYLRSWDTIASKRPDTIIAISGEVKKRIKKYYNVDSSIIFPPLMLTTSRKEKPVENKDFLLVVSRLVPYKRVELAIKACNMLKLPLVVVGIGAQEKYLRSIAGKTVTFAGSLTDEELVPYYRQCKALLFAGTEDFGLTMVEAQSFGKPVVAYKEGGALDIVTDLETGVFFSSQTVPSLMQAIQQMQTISWNSSIITKSAEKFSLEVFQKAFIKEVERVLAKPQS